ncbi:glutathione-specific gamma-glutamylcyclotransferase Ggg1 [Schizosaccharomyces pombe]|uniref:Glutathione-specific gamma-glutamylcyclotransferase n=1 Tax=Schizosaccharomyces pombe (strain 972 / ATCC 24843) TaxID=284812 RepID=CHAC_SCHPO|nr:putative ChaC-like cation transport regulator [Schizosaccharomyces pombe]P87305.1 RecName: Full=Glutathione-specific gamma-glutamylcyclotransferase; Short=Gamma-GCG [Schizosaccharomyces pombe 972h-]CAB10080.1 ChaC-like protein, predicted cation transport regulator [Schizosaccharomyces pombe]|eukprot:NP_596565.1 putative ChaC-like cation transport regulator [Schizosaccharomyces pombe]
MKTLSPEGSLWVFGYGSLIWHPPPHYDYSIPCFIKGYVRRFWMRSEDHRGTVNSPGLVLTLIPYEEWKQFSDWSFTPFDEGCWGMAFRIPAKYATQVREYLDDREVNGYTAHSVPVYAHTGDEIPVLENCLVYVGTSKSPQFQPSDDLTQMAKIISTRRGKSGDNFVYLFELAKCLRHLSPESKDIHVFELEAEVRKQMQKTR